MSTVVDYGQRLFALVRVVVDDSLVTKEDFFDFVHAQVRLYHDVVAVVFKTVGYNVLFEELDVVLDVQEVFEAQFFRLAVTVYTLNLDADGRVIVVAQDEALAFVWAEVRYLLSHCFLLTKHW